jgi:hypothetical protein
MPQDPPRHDADPDDGLLDFDSELPHSALDKKESDLALNRNEPDPPLNGSEPVVIVDGGEQDIALGSRQPASDFDSNDQEIFFNRQEGDITSGKPDPQPDAHVLPLHAPSVQPFVWYTSDPVVHRRARRNIGIALLMLAGIGALAGSGRLLMGMRGDAGTSGAQIHSASQPTPTVPPAPDRRLTATDVPAETATPSEPAPAIATPSQARGANAPDAPRTERPARQAERRPITTEPNAAGGLFAITRPVGAQVFLDNKLIGTTPLFMSQLASGSHEVRLELPGFTTYSSSIHVEPNTRFRLAVQLDGTR